MEGGMGGMSTDDPSAGSRDVVGSPSLARLARAPLALGRLFSNSISIASW